MSQRNTYYHDWQSAKGFTHTHIQEVLLIRAVCQAWHRFLLRLISINLNCKRRQWETGNPRKDTRHKQKMSPEATGFRSTSLCFAVLNLIKRFDWRNARLSIRKLSVRFSAGEFWNSTLHRRVVSSEFSSLNSIVSIRSCLFARWLMQDFENCNQIYSRCDWHTRS